MQNFFKRMVSLFLTIILVLNLLPLGIFAEEVSASIAVSQEAESSDGEAVWIVDEIVDERSEYIKEFKLNNGLHLAAVYPEAVHYEASDGS